MKLGVHACRLARDCRRFDAPNRVHINTPWGMLYIALNRDAYIQAHGSRPEDGDWRPIVWQPHDPER